MTAIDITQQQIVTRCLEQFKSFTADEKLQLLWQIYQRMEPSVLSAAAVALLSQMVQGVFTQVRQLSRADQVVALRDIVAGEPTRISQAYASLNVNMKLALWYRLAQAMARGQISRPDTTQNPSAAGNSLVDEMSQMGFNQQIFFLRQVMDYIG